MHSLHLTPFATQKYLNLESCKRDGTPVQTPVWFAEEHGVLYVYTLANARKVKRIRRHPRIRITPCTMRGTVTGHLTKEEYLSWHMQQVFRGLARHLVGEDSSRRQGD
jgi:PPOX class probable F420-dependent enzyme